MVRQINIFLDDEEHEIIKKAKGDLTWVNFLRACSKIILEKNKNDK